MSEMVERVARAIALASYPYAENDINQHGIAVFADIVEENFMEAARAAIEAMREPTELMFEAAWASALAEDAKGVWRDMIDEALK